MRADIRFAGMALRWSEEYAASYAAKLKEMGYYVRIAPAPDSSLIVYSYKPFTKAEMEESLASLEKETADKSSDSVIK
jgi:hypothetical protein